MSITEDSEKSFSSFYPPKVLRKQKATKQTVMMLIGQAKKKRKPRDLSNPIIQHARDTTQPTPALPRNPVSPVMV